MQENPWIYERGGLAHDFDVAQLSHTCLRLLNLVQKLAPFRVHHGYGSVFGNTDVNQWELYFFSSQNIPDYYKYTCKPK